VLAAIATGAVAFGAWVYLAAARGRFWNIRETASPQGSPDASVAVVIPARNEAAHIGAAVRSLERQQYAGSVSIFVVDDNSEDGTAEVACAVSSKTTVLAGQPLPAGWTGKMWAVHQGVERANPKQPDYLLLTDADIIHGPDTIRGLVARSEEGSLDLVSYMVLLRVRTLPERLLIPAFVFFFLKLYPPAWITDPKRQTAGAAGGCILIRRTALERAGGIAAIRSELIDDCALARRVKETGGGIWMGLTPSAHSTREYPSFGEIRRMIARTAYTQLNYSPILLAGTVAGMLLIYVAPVALLFTRNRAASAVGAAAWALMSALYVPVLRFYHLPAAYAPLLPAIALFYTAATIDSAVRHYSGLGGLWRGRVTVRPTSASPSHLDSPFQLPPP
jgi:hopene-associated glycosyltransferase HpnB